METDRTRPGKFITLLLMLALFALSALFWANVPACIAQEDIKVAETNQTPPSSEPAVTPTTKPVTTTTKPTVAPKPVPKPAAKAAVPALNRTLRFGLGGEDVRYLQRRLTDLKYSPGAIDGYYSRQTYHAVIAFQKVNGLARDGVAGPKTLAVLSKPKVIAARYGGNHIEVHRNLQVLLVVKGGKVSRIIACSTGKPGFSTPRVTASVYRKPGYRYWSRKYGGLMIWSSFFYGGVAVHGFSSVPAYPASHGCVRVPIPDSKYVYDNMPVKSRVYVY